MRNEAFVMMNLLTAAFNDVTDGISFRFSWLSVRPEGEDDVTDGISFRVLFSVPAHRACALTRPGVHALIGGRSRASCPVVIL